MSYKRKFEIVFECKDENFIDLDEWFIKNAIAGYVKDRDFECAFENEELGGYFDIRIHECKEV